MSNIVECDCCNEEKECIRCEYGHNLCIECKVLSNSPFDECFFCYPISEDSDNLNNHESEEDDDNEVDEENQSEITFKEYLLILVVSILSAIILTFFSLYIFNLSF